ncbi:hypothetical protein [Spirillospora sp. CA-294931]|uniref:hypothetical protein n=1 Tax=Spirillospora sp. CA-294931 TaxID=3240042 RepID=UPI003D8F9D6A
MNRSAPRRARWAARENERRRHAHEAALGRWHSDETLLRAMIRAAQFPHAITPPPIPLKRGEFPLWSSSDVYMVEPDAYVPLAAADHRAFSLETFGTAPGRPPHRIRDHGIALVTDRRVLFRGTGGTREWAHAKIVAIHHDPHSPCTLIHVANRKRTSGLLLHPSEVPAFRFAFTQGVAEHADDRAAFVAHLEALHENHRHAFPPPPLLARPEETPAPAGRIVAGVVAGVLALVVLIGLIGLVVAGQQPPNREATLTSPSTSASPTSPTPKPPTRTTHAKPPQTITSTRPPPVESTRPPPVESTRPPPVRSAKPEKLCGAPSNPHGYSFCSGKRIYEPAPDVCGHFDCIPAFTTGKGYMIQCKDRKVSMSGGRPGACSHHGGVLRPVHR